jgi:class 3 adenylate cyclase
MVQSGIVEEIAELLKSERIELCDKETIGRLIVEYQKLFRRNQKIIRMSDRVTDELFSRSDKLETLSNRLSKYLSPQIYELIFLNDSKPLKSTRKKLTIFFSDIKDFTSTTEKLESEELTALLNDYLTRMSDIALKYGATIDKYIGDAIMIFFGDPDSLGYQEDAKTCVEMAIDMQKEIKSFEREYVGNGIINSFKVRMGIHTGYATVGNFGSEKRMEYTIIGGNVNLASRLEGIAEPNTILLSHETYSLVKEFVNVIPKDPILVKGISKTIKTYQLIDLKRVDQSANLIKKQVEMISQNIKVETKEDIINELQKIIDSLKDSDIGKESW